MKSIISHAANDIVRSASDMHEIKEVKMVPKICKNLDDKKIPWAAITAYKSCLPGGDCQAQLRKNKAGNIALFSRLRNVLGRGAETINRFIGKWPADDSSSTPEREESFLVCKPKNMTQEEFESLMVSLGSKYNQDCVVVSSNGQSRCMPCRQESRKGADES